MARLSPLTILLTSTLLTIATSCRGRPHPPPAPRDDAPPAPAAGGVVDEGDPERSDPGPPLDPARPDLPPRGERFGDEISVCGRLFPIGVPVVLWSDPGGYDAYSLVTRFADAPGEEKRRFGERRDLPAGIEERVEREGWSLDDLQDVVHLFVLHYDVAGCSRQCFKILHDMRNLSVHFLLDVDGTIYQTLDLKERAWHATIANNHGIGIEIAHPGAYPQPGGFARWYERDEDERYRMRFPNWLKETGVRVPDFVIRPARPGIQTGRVNGGTLHQRDFTEAQYRALVHLTAGLSRVFPRIPLEAPRSPDGTVTWEAMEPDDLHAFEGIVGHYHVTRRKSDPGPAFQWERLLREARALNGVGEGRGEGGDQ